MTSSGNHNREGAKARWREGQLVLTRKDIAASRHRAFVIVTVGYLGAGTIWTIVGNRSGWAPGFGFG